MNKDEIQDKIKELEAELIRLKKQINVSDLDTVSVPEEFSSIFHTAKEKVHDYFQNLEMNPERGSIRIDNERYILIRASSLSSKFFEHMEKLYENDANAFDLTSNFLFDMAYVIGKEDAKRFHEKMGITDPQDKIASGPVYFAYAGWAKVKFNPDSNPTPDLNYLLKYDHPYSFEAESWLAEGKKSETSVCIMNAAYSAGWCSESFGIQLTAVETSCRAKGDDCCSFIMAHPSKINEILSKELKVKGQKSKLPPVLENFTLQEKLLYNKKLFNTAQKVAKLGSWEFDISLNQIFWSDETYSIFEIDKLNTTPLMDLYYSRLHPDDITTLNKAFELCLTNGIEYSIIHRIILEHEEKTLSCSGAPIYDSEQKIIKIVGVVQDITFQENQQKELEENLKEKEVLLKEVHHRVKNNLQIISSLLHLQADLIENESIRSIFEESRMRVQSIASIHELLYQSDNFSNINFNEYLNTLIQNLLYSFVGAISNIEIQVNSLTSINIETAVPLGLLVNEILTNSLKHGLKNEPGDQLFLTLENYDAEKLSLKIGDNGKGLSKKQFENTENTLGMLLIHELSKQLDGEIELLETEKGSVFHLVFSKQNMR
jgi:two-component sensor histidine kinase